MKEIRGVLPALLKSLGLENRYRGFQAAESWEEFAGPALAARSRVADFRDGRLVVEVQSPAAMQELSARKKALLARFTERHGPGLVTEIQLVPGGRPGGTDAPTPATRR